MKILIVEDEVKTGDYLRQGLTEAGFVVDLARDGLDGLHLALNGDYDLVVLDVMLPRLDGWGILQTLRRSSRETPVLFLTARDQVEDRVRGLELGADDYLSKPFHLAELEARVRSLTRRQFIQRDICLRCGRLSFDTKSRVASVDGQPLSLTRKECGVLEYLLLHQGRPISQEELMEHVWDASVDSFSGAIRVHMSSLRRKLKAVLGYDAIMNKVGEGYKIREESD